MLIVYMLVSSFRENVFAKVNDDGLRTPSNDKRFIWPFKK